MALILKYQNKNEGWFSTWYIFFQLTNISWRFSMCQALCTRNITVKQRGGGQRKAWISPLLGFILSQISLPPPFFNIVFFSTFLFYFLGSRFKRYRRPYSEQYLLTSVFQLLIPSLEATKVISFLSSLLENVTLFKQTRIYSFFSFLQV